MHRPVRLKIVASIATSLLALGAEGFESSSDAPPTQRRQVVTIAAIVQRSGGRDVTKVRWYGSHALAVSIASSGSDRPVTQLLSREGKLGMMIGQGTLFSTSPGGQYILEHTADEWIVKCLDLDEAWRIPEPNDESRRFMAYHDPVWSRDGRFVAIIEHYRPKAADHHHSIELMDGVTVIEVGNSIPAGEQWEARVTIIDVPATTVVSRVTIDGMAAGAQWGSGHSLFISRTHFFGRVAQTSLLRINPKGAQAEEFYRTAGRFQQMRPAVHPAGHVIALVLDADNRAWSDFQSIVLVEAASGRELRRLTHDIPVLGGDYTWSHRGDELYARVRNGGYDSIYAFPQHGKPRRLRQASRRHFDMDLSPDGRSLSYRTEDGYGRKDIRILDLVTGEEKIVLVLDDPTQEFLLGEWRRIRWKSTAGLEPFGFLVLPPDFDPERKYPMLVDVHGGGAGSRLGLEGPLTLATARGPLERHAWAALGYVVFVPDYRSSGMYGPAPIAARYRAGEIAAIDDLDDIVSGTCHMMGQGYIDPGRVAILGHSAGGQRVFLLLARTDLYSAAVLNEVTSPDPVSNLISLATGRYAGSYPEGMLRQMLGGDLSEVPNRYKQIYILDSHRVITPTLIMMGNEKLGGMAHMPAEVFFSILRQRGVPARLLKFVDEGHTYTRPESAMLAFEQARKWLQMHTLNAHAPTHRPQPHSSCRPLG